MTKTLDISLDEDSTETTSSTRAWGVSILFWLAIVLAVTLYGAVALSPKLLKWRQLKVEKYNNQVKLVTLEWQVKYLKRVVRAFEHDPNFAAEQARIDFDASQPGEERIPVDPSLTLDSRTSKPIFPKADARLPWYADTLDMLSTHDGLRRACLISAALITVVSFTFLQESQVQGFKNFVRSVVQTIDRATARYRTTRK
ncbi:hypothetical protein [Thalassoroseus pseudoceratinae]|uniref:hypothetical protein n=1 Tax=Thalassoroseus pseudoceratinae TaxID=2713176 RepID=UPI00141FE2E1|nr:hypothetical protein [Thalassoroseus pseudoceratinae]